MTSPRTFKRIDALVWVLIFGGLLAVVYGLMLQRYEGDAGLGFVLAGAVLAVLGALLIVLRARLKADAPPATPLSHTSRRDS